MSWVEIVILHLGCGLLSAVWQRLYVGEKMSIGSLLAIFLCGFLSLFAHVIGLGLPWIWEKVCDLLSVEV